MSYQLKFVTGRKTLSFDFCRNFERACWRNNWPAKTENRFLRPQSCSGSIKGSIFLLIHFLNNCLRFIALSSTLSTFSSKSNYRRCGT